MAVLVGVMTQPVCHDGAFDSSLTVVHLLCPSYVKYSKIQMPLCSRDEYVCMKSMVHDYAFIQREISSR